MMFGRWFLLITLLYGVNVEKRSESFFLPASIFSFQEYNLLPQSHPPAPHRLQSCFHQGVPPYSLRLVGMLVLFDEISMHDQLALCYQVHHSHTHLKLVLRDQLSCRHHLPNPYHHLRLSVIIITWVIDLSSLQYLVYSFFSTDC